MQTRLRVQSATEAQMRRALLAWHRTSKVYDPPRLTLDGLVVRVEGPRHYTVESPPIPSARVRAILAAMEET